VTKSVTPGRALVGATVTYTILVENEGVFDETGLTVVDEMPSGLRFVPGSAQVNGSATPEPVAAGRRLSWADLDVASGANLVVTLQARVVEGPGRLENIAYVLGRDGEVISNIASAILEVPPEAVFDCSDDQLAHRLCRHIRKPADHAPDTGDGDAHELWGWFGRCD